MGSFFFGLKIFLGLAVLVILVIIPKGVCPWLLSLFSLAIWQKNTAKFKVFLTTESWYLNKLTKIHAIFVLEFFFLTCLRLLEHCVKGQTALCLGNLGLFLQKFQLSRRLVRHPLISHTFKIKAKIKKMSEEIVKHINLIRFHLWLDFSVKIILSILSDFLRQEKLTKKLCNFALLLFHTFWGA